MLTALPSLAFVLALAALAAFLVRRTGWRPAALATAEFAVVARTRLDGRRALCQIRRGHVNILVLTGGGGDVVLDRWETEASVSER